MTAVATTALSGVRADLFDCVQVNLAVLADRYHGPDTHLLLGSVLRFRPEPGPLGLPTVEPAYLAQVDEACRWLGLAEAGRWTGTPPGELSRLAARHGRLYAVGDSHGMPWLPYYGRRHMEHSFLVEPAGGRALVTDAYDNQTQWGAARPGQWELDWDELPAATLTLCLEPAASGPEAPAPRADLAPPEPYVDAYAAHADRPAALDRLTVETWLLARSRRLHAVCLAHGGAASSPRVADHVRQWEQVAGQAYVTLRRVQRGRPEPPGLLPGIRATLEADRDVFGSPAAPGTSPDADTATRQNTTR
ncbi:hypothetical protein [Streptomyces sp. JW3]|uniref:hypothetical protein n=1 Tax=Streptomyces sp. JW3 TaxID=3456955 RepID=UPI003FA49B67